MREPVWTSIQSCTLVDCARCHHVLHLVAGPLTKLSNAELLQAFGFRPCFDLRAQDRMAILLIVYDRHAGQETVFVVKHVPCEYVRPNVIHRGNSFLYSACVIYNEVGSLQHSPSHPPRPQFCELFFGYILSGAPPLPASSSKRASLPLPRQRQKYFNSHHMANGSSE